MKFQQTRESVLKTCLALAEQGFLAGTGGNVALRVDQVHFAVTPSGTDYYAMTPADICVLRLEDKVQIEGEHPASVEAGLHAAVFKARPDCSASVHTHQPVASAYTLLAQPLAIENSEQRLVLGKSVPCVGYAPSGTGLLAWRVGRAFGPGTHCCLMRNHGVVCVGTDPEEAMGRVALLEAVCSAYFRSSALNDSSPVDRSIRTLVAETLDPLHGSKINEVTT